MEVLARVPELGAPTATAIAAAIVAGAATLMTVMWRASMTHEETTAGLDDEGQRASTAAASSVAVQQARHASPIAASMEGAARSLAAAGDTGPDGHTRDTLSEHVVVARFRGLLEDVVDPMMTAGGQQPPPGAPTGSWALFRTEEYTQHENFTSNFGIDQKQESVSFQLDDSGAHNLEALAALQVLELDDHVSLHWRHEYTTAAATPNPAEPACASPYVRRMISLTAINEDNMLSVKKEHDFKKALTQLSHQADVAEAERKRERQNRARDRTSLTPGSLTTSANESLLFMDVSALDARIAQEDVDRAPVRRKVLSEHCACAQFQSLVSDGERTSTAGGTTIEEVAADGTALLEAKFAITEYTRHCMLDAHLGPDKRQTQVSFLLSAGVHSPAAVAKVHELACGELVFLHWRHEHVVRGSTHADAYELRMMSIETM